MVLDKLLDLILLVVVVPLEALPTFELPAWFSGASDCQGSVTTLGCRAWEAGQTLAQLGNWLPLDVLTQCMTFAALSWVVAKGIGGVRLLVSLLTGGGGA